MKTIRIFLLLLSSTITIVATAQNKNKIKKEITAVAFNNIKIEDYTLSNIIKEHQTKGSLQGFYNKEVVVTESPKPVKGLFFRYDVGGTTYYFKSKEVTNKKTAELIGISVKKKFKATIKGTVIKKGNPISKLDSSIQPSEKGVLVYKVKGTPLKCKIIHKKGKIRRVKIGFVKGNPSRD